MSRPDDRHGVRVVLDPPLRLPGARSWRDILAGYAVSVALNRILPANIGTFVLLVMFSATIAGATFAGVLGSYAVEKIFFTVVGAFVYLYLFLEVGGSFDMKFSFLHDKPVATILAPGRRCIPDRRAARAATLAARRQLVGAGEGGGAVLAHPRAYFARVFLPSLISWLAMLTGIGVLLAAYGIPVTFSTPDARGGRQLDRERDVGHAGRGRRDPGVQRRLAEGRRPPQPSDRVLGREPIAQHRVEHRLRDLILMVWAWGWTGGKQLVSDSYEDAKRREAEEREKRRQRRRRRPPSRRARLMTASGSTYASGRGGSRRARGSGRSGSS